MQSRTASIRLNFARGTTKVPSPPSAALATTRFRSITRFRYSQTNLEVVGGAERWHAENDFDLSWSNPSQDGAPIAAVRFRVLDSDGSVVTPLTRVADPAPRLEDLEVPDGPGHYTVEVSLEDAAGNVGQPARASLRFDDQRPGRADPKPAGEWLSRGEIPYVQEISGPAEPLPVSGVLGYAVSVDGTPGSDPCVAPDRCTESETDLKGGTDENRMQLSDLPEGTSWVHSVAVSRSGMKSVAVGHAEIHVDKTDPVTVLEGVPSGWTNGNVALVARSVDSLSGMQPADQEAPVTAIRVGSSAPVTSVGDTVSASVTGEGTHTVAYYARDLAGNVNNGELSNGIQNRPPGVAKVRIDRTPPGLAFANAQDPEDPELIRATVRDPLSGPDPEVGRVLVRRVGRDEPFRPLPTELVDGALQARWNSDAYPAGEYEFRATALDQAGNVAGTARRANGRAMVLPNPIKVPTAIRAAFAVGRERVGRKRARTVPYGQSVRLSGRLTAGLGSPLSGERVRLVERFAAGARRPKRVSRLRTDARGRFSLRLAPGPSRTVRAYYAGTRTLTRSRSRQARLRVRSGVTFSTSAPVARVGGAPVIFAGRVKRGGALIPADGKEIALQYRVGRLGWTTFRTVATDPRGRFRLSYRFTDDESRGVLFRFRALATSQSDWPFAPQGSNVRSVRGR